VLANSDKQRVFVMGAYYPNGGTYIAYQLALILHLDFDFEIMIISDQGANHGVFDYPIVFPTISESEVVESATDDDILIANPSFSPHWFGLRCKGRKVMYIQGFSTFQLLDCRFDHYVTVSTFVQRFIAGTYGIQTRVIPPFIHADRFPRPMPWRERRVGSILVSMKGDQSLQNLLLDRLRRELSTRGCDASLTDLRLQQRPQSELLAQIGQYRHFLTLSPAEGFGLMPLEAMAMGATVLGFDGFGGCDYMRPGRNCDVTTFADIEGVADRIARAVAEPDYAEALAMAGQETAKQTCYTYDNFCASWREEFERLFGEHRDKRPLTNEADQYSRRS
jgi:hypothetical protein